MINVILEPQEVIGNNQFTTQVVATRNFMSVFKDSAPIIVIETLRLIHQRRDTIGCDYFQIASVSFDGAKPVKYWVIEDCATTFLMPEDY